MRGRAAAVALTAAFALSACGGGDGNGNGNGGDDAASPPDLSARGAFIPEPATADLAAAFLTVENAGGTDDALTSVTSDIAGTVEIHETVDNAMRQVDALPVPAGGELDLARGGNHVMLMDLTSQPVEGDTVTLELHFETSDPIALDVPVESATHTGE
ncbi:copper chaperone PCu(A)C [Streptomyces radicis]|uniref:Copper chaperone PCu(A)C n=1 Tax=Streptomyces radicis TaxID=1750517 RepID=A0A3A9W1X7_9ACTN|nr:copper chaperone PCu(A)C [Streptomyces radicis]RKN07235.1 copper chaperone PCu(A)C [Streptomyces radicis]RKN26747.1 copper chaperone PCu(A)C [Streptomyces radicis]